MTGGVVIRLAASVGRDGRADDFEIHFGLFNFQTSFGRVVLAHDPGHFLVRAGASSLQPDDV